MMTGLALHHFHFCETNQNAKWRPSGPSTNCDTANSIEVTWEKIAGYINVHILYVSIDGFTTDSCTCKYLETNSRALKLSRPGVMPALLTQLWDFWGNRIDLDHWRFELLSYRRSSE